MAAIHGCHKNEGGTPFLNKYIFEMIERCFIRMVVLVGLLMVGWGDDVHAQFHEMEGLPWVPARPDKKNGSADDRGVVVLDELSAALQNGEYRQVVDRLYPLAISSGFQRNTNLYNQTRRAMRQLLQEPDGAVYWNKMERLYHDRFANLGKEDYRYRNTLETASWSEEQLNNEQLLMLSKVEGGMERCFDRAHQILSQTQGKIDPVIVVQGMFVPLNREHAAHPERGKEYANRYNEILRWLDAAEQFMLQEHREEYQTYYSTQALAMVREESDRQMNADASIAAFEARRLELQDEMRQQADWLDTEQRAQRLYAEAVELYQKSDYAKAYQKVNEALAAESNMKEAHVLKSSILQRASNASNRMSDKVAFWCAAYEAGQGYVDRKTQRHILSALKSHLFMTGLAGHVHSTRTPFSIRQRIWTVEELKEK
jgi:hypothetical protein